MINEKNKKKIKIAVTCLIIVLIIWFVILNPLLKFNNMEKKVLEAAERYYEISPKLLPTGEKISTVSLQKLYEKDFISSDLKVPYSSKLCDSKTSWVKVKKDNGEYKYYVYLKCGVFSSNIDHDGPTINLKGEEEITIYKGDKYKDAGIESVIDNTDGKIDIKKVTVDTSKVNTNKNGTYEVTYKIKDSFNNETIKTRKVNVIQTLNNIVKKATDKTNIYKGYHDDNYIKLDGILFKIIGINDDGTIKLTSADNLAAVNYEDIDSWLNDYFYNKLSDSVKTLISKEKWCNEKVADPSTYKQCKKNSKKRAIGLLSVADINNSKSSDGINNIDFNSNSWTSDYSDSKKAISINENKFNKTDKEKNLLIKPTLNIKKDSLIGSGDGKISNPYIFKENNSKVKVGNKLSEAKTGEYFIYSGYVWRVIGTEDDGTIKVIMDEVLNINDKTYNTTFNNKQKIDYSKTEKGNIGYKLVNEISSYVKTKIFVNHESEKLNYTNEIGYKAKTDMKTYKSKINLPSIYDLYSTSLEEDFWFLNHSNSSNTACKMSFNGNVYCEKYLYSFEYGVRAIAYIKESIKIKGGTGTIDEPYTLAS